MWSPDRLARRAEIATLALLLCAPQAALALPVTFEVLSSDVEVSASVLGVPSDQSQTVAVSGTNDAELLGLLSATPSLELTGGDLVLGPVDLTLAGHVAEGRALEGGSTGGPVIGTPVGPHGSEGIFVFSDFLLTLDSGTLDVAGSLVNSFRDLALGPLAIPFPAGTELGLTAAPAGGGMIDLRLAVPVDTAVPVDLPGTSIPVTLILLGDLVMGASVAAPEPARVTLLLVGLATLALLRRSGTVRRRILPSGKAERSA